MKKTLIAVPCMDTVAAPFAHSLALLTKQGEVYIEFQIASLIYQSRETLVKHAIQGNLDYILWLDSDMTFDPDTLQRLFKTLEDNDADIVSGLYFRRAAPYTPDRKSVV